MKVENFIDSWKTECRFESLYTRKLSFLAMIIADRGRSDNKLEQAARARTRAIMSF